MGAKRTLLQHVLHLGLPPKAQPCLIAWPEPLYSFKIIERLLSTDQMDRSDRRRQMGVDGGSCCNGGNPAQTDLWNRNVAGGPDMEPCLLRFHATYVSATEAGDYYQISFETEDPADDAVDSPILSSPYLIIQRQFETPDDRLPPLQLVGGERA